MSLDTQTSWSWHCGCSTAITWAGDGRCGKALRSGAIIRYRSPPRIPAGLTRLHGRCRKGQRCSKAPFGHWKTQTFIAGLRCDGLTALCRRRSDEPAHLGDLCRDAARSRAWQRAMSSFSTISPPTRAQAVNKAIRARGAWPLLRAALQSRAQPDRKGPSSKLKQLRARAIKTIDALWQAIGDICSLFVSVRQKQV